MSRKKASYCRKSAGMTLVEVVVALAVLATVLCALISVLMTSWKLDELTREHEAAANGIVEMAELMRNEDFADLYDYYSPGGVIGNTFDIPELQGDLDPPVGTITFIMNEDPGSADGDMLGLPLDLDGDGATTTADVRSSHALLPIKLNVTWDGVMGSTTMNFYFLLAQAYSD